MSLNPKQSGATHDLTKLLVAATGVTHLQVRTIRASERPGCVEVEITYLQNAKMVGASVPVECGYVRGMSLYEEPTLVSIRENWPQNWMNF